MSGKVPEKIRGWEEEKSMRQKKEPLDRLRKGIKSRAFGIAIKEPIVP